MSLPSDPASQANWQDVASEHVHFDWLVDFAKQTLSGSATHTLVWRTPDVREVVFDTQALDVQNVLVDGQPAEFSLGPTHAVMGAPLTVALPANRAVGDKIRVQVFYRTTQDCTALQWLDKEHVPPLLSSVGRAASGPSPSSSTRPTGSSAKTSTSCVPSPISSLSTVPPTLKLSLLPPRFLVTAETILPPYRFGVYDVLVLPPSFPYGGMENACLTFLTPTLLVGDRTLVDVVVHELTHSWFGNGVTQANSTHFWLNEGWTTYIERVLLQLLHTPADRGFSFLIGRTALANALAQYAAKPKYQRLVIDFDVGEDPDDAYSTVPYEKGANFLLHLERVLGGLDAFLPYVREYVAAFSGRSITTEDWKRHLYAGM
ncbi:hypothetical protein BN946_scf184920.g14 [Trametes cinnabarina]|uniref:Peptidase M1 membrane alanine aminopeptidase domain-containing protein n=1 Tax=Pycnoporus cinnabarinus TaxID=5643 RepID=A0A060SBK2_PYCCI|nr:hypothetical protein BN946_scf184920.g14 [Trametes cinnabarina]